MLSSQHSITDRRLSGPTRSGKPLETPLDHCKAGASGPLHIDNDKREDQRSNLVSDYKVFSKSDHKPTLLRLLPEGQGNVSKRSELFQIVDVSPPNFDMYAMPSFVLPLCLRKYLDVCVLAVAGSVHYRSVTSDFPTPTGC
jgi:hypothetical protein